MKKITLMFVLLFAGFSTFAQTTHNLDWYMGITSADASLTIDVGDTVIWTFTDTAPHSVTSDAGSTETFDSGTLSTGVGATWSYTFTTAGTNPYHCNVHPSMVGTITVNAVVTCPDPTALTATAITSTSADLGWTEAGTATTWDLYVVPAGDPAPTATSAPTDAGVTTNPYTKTGLTANTAYDFYVRADCGAGSLSAWVGPFSFTTVCGTIVAPWSEDFSNAGNIPNCWSQDADPAKDWEFDDTTGSNHIGNNGTIIGNSQSDGYFAWVDDSSPHVLGTTLLSPFIDVSGLTIPELTFYRLSNNEGNTNVDFSVDVWDGAAWNNVYFSNTNSAGGGWEKIIVNLSTLTITGDIQIRFVVDENNGTDFYDDVAIDDVDVHEQPTCPQPNTLTATAITATTADLGWTETGTATLWDVHVVFAGDPAPTATTTPTNAGVLTNPYTATGLSPCQSYEFYVRADCGAGDLSFWSGPIGFSTAAGAIASFSENFDNLPEEVLPNCWSSIVTATSSFASADTDDGDSFSAPNNLEFYNSGDAAAVLIVATPELTDLPLSTHQMRFQAKADSDGVLEIGTMTDPTNAATFTLVQTVAATTSYQEFIVPFSTATTDTYIAFKATYTGTYSDINVDDVFWELIPSCTKPNTLTAASILQTSADLGWTESGTATAWDLYVVPTGDPAPTATSTPTDTGVTTNPYNKTGLTANTSYDFYVRADCGAGGLSIWEGPFTFKTLCSAVTTPWFDDVEGFSDTTGFTTLNCWTATATTSYDWNVEANGAANSSDTGPDNPYSGVAYFYIEASGSSVGEVAELYTPMIDVTGLTVPALKFYYHMYGVVMGDLHVDVHDGTAWNMDVLIISGQQQTAGSDPWLSSLIDISAYAASGTVQIRFRAIGAGDYEGDISLDDISVIEMPTCLQPTALTAANVLSTSANLGWTEAGTATMWDVHVVPAGDPAPTATTVPSDTGVMTNPYNKTGLTADTNYEFYVRADCGGGDLSLWSGPIAFFTGYCASVPTSNDGTGITNIQVGTTNFTGTDVTYLDFTATPVNLAQNVQANLQVTFDTGYTYDTNVWIDFNDDLIFDSTELLFSGASTSNQPTTLDASFLMPATATLGNHRMRIGTADIGQSTPDPCYNGSYGVTADLTINVTAPPSCTPPNTLTATNILAGSADLGWTEAGTATMWDVYVVLAGDPAPTATTTPTDAGVMTNPYNKTGLSSATNYEFYVRADCGGGLLSAWAGPYAFTTACGIFTLPFSEDFTGSSTPNCWTETGTGNWDYSTGADYGAASAGDHTPGGGTNYAWVDASSPFALGDTATLTTPLVDLSTLTTPALKFFLFSNNTNSTDVATVDVEVYDGAAWNNVLTSTAWSPNWVKYLIDLSPYTTTTTTLQVRFIVTGGGGFYNDILLDDISFVEMPTCIVPTGLSATSILATSADLGWTENNTPAATTWDVHVVTAGSPAPTATTTPSDPGVTTGVTTPYNKTGLTAQTDYEFYVRTDCGGGDLSIWAGPFAFSTPCVAVALPYLESFSSGTFPGCWSRTSTTDVTIEATCGTRSNVLNISDTNEVVTVPIDASMATNGVIVSYFIGDDLCGGATEDPFDVEYWNGTQWVLAKTYITNGGEPYDNAYFHDSFMVPASDATAGFKVRFSSNETFNGDNWYIDEFLVEMPPCYDPSNIVIDNITQTQANVSWTENGVATEWEIEYGPTGFAQGTGTIVLDNNGVLGETITPLTPATVYDVYVRALCASGASGATSGWVGPITFTTDCATLTTLPYTESFEDTSQYRVCWTDEYVSGDENWEFVTANQNGTITPRTGTKMAEFGTTNPTGDVTKFVTPSLDLTTLTNPQLVFYYANVSWLGDIDELRIYYKTSATGTWTQIGADYTAEQTTWTEVTLSLPNPSNDYYIAFEGTSNYGRGLDVDDVWVGEAPITCEAPTNVAVSNEQAQSADFSWDAVANATNGYEWFVFVAGDDPSVDSPVVTGTTPAGTTTVNVTGLTSETSYDFYVAADCGATDGMSSLAGPLPFMTTFGISDQVFEGFSYYPNPVSSTLSLKATSEIQQVIVYDLLGQEVMKVAPNSFTPTLKFHDLQVGTYLMKVTINGSVGVFRVIKE